MSYQCVATDGEAFSTSTPVESFTVVPPFVKTANILLVMDQADQVNDQPLPRYEAAPDAAGLAYDVWNSALRGPINGTILRLKERICSIEWEQLNNRAERHLGRLNGRAADLQC